MTNYILSRNHEVHYVRGRANVSLPLFLHTPLVDGLHELSQGIATTIIQSRSCASIHTEEHAANTQQRSELYKTEHRSRARERGNT